MSGEGVYELPDTGSRGPVVLVTAVGGAKGGREAAAAVACAGSEPDRAGLMIELDDVKSLRSTSVATAGARALEERLAAHLPEAPVASRGAICRVGLDPGSLPAALPLARDSVAAIHLPPAELQAVLGDPRVAATAVLLRAELAVDRALVALAVGDVVARGLRVTVLKHRPAWLPARLALNGVVLPGLPALPWRPLARLLGDRERERISPVAPGA